MMYFILFAFFLFYFAAHWLVYCFFICVLNCQKQKQKYFLRISLIILASSFIAAFFISHYWDNIFTKIFYISSGLWIGILINLSLFIGAYGLLNLVFILLNKDFNKKIFSRIFLSFAIIYSMYGVANVFFINVKEINVRIKDLPEVWEGKKIIQISDLHLGRVLGKDFLDKVVMKVNKEKPELIVMTGDIFDATDGRMDRFIDSLNSFKSNKGSYFITGNHEIYLGPEEINKTLAQTDINILNDEIVVLDGLQLIGINYPGFVEKKDIAGIIKKDKNFNTEQASILLFHLPANILPNESNNHSDVYLNPDIDFKGARDLGIDLQLSGHTHKGQLFPFNFITYLIFKGHDYGLQEIGDFSIYTSSGTGVWGPTMRTSGRSEIVVITLEKK